MGVQEVVRQVPRVQVQGVVKQLPAPVTTVQAAPTYAVQAAPTYAAPVMETFAPAYAAPVVEAFAPTYAAPTTFAAPTSFGTSMLAAPTIGGYGAPTIGTSYGTVL